MSPEPVQMRYLRRREAAAYLRLSVPTLAAMAAQGRGPAYSKAARVAIYDVDDLDAWVAQHRCVPTPAFPNKA